MFQRGLRESLQMKSPDALTEQQTPPDPINCPIAFVIFQIGYSPVPPRNLFLMWICFQEVRKFVKIFQSHFYHQRSSSMICHAPFHSSGFLQTQPAQKLRRYKIA